MRSFIRPQTITASHPPKDITTSSLHRWLSPNFGDLNALLCVLRSKRRWLKGIEPFFFLLLVSVTAHQDAVLLPSHLYLSSDGVHLRCSLEKLSVRLGNREARANPGTRFLSIRLLCTVDEQCYLLSHRLKVLTTFRHTADRR